MLTVERPGTENRLASVAMYVRSHLDERLTLEGLASRAGLSPFHFHRLFRVAFGENLNAYVVRHRMMRAAHELRYSARAVTEIALACGYDSPSSFGRAFSRAFGTSPSAYRDVPDARSRLPETVSPAIGNVPEPRVARYEAREALALRFTGPYDALEPTFGRLLDIARRRRFLPGASVLGLSSGSPDLQEHDVLRFDACVTIAPHADVEGALADGVRRIRTPAGRFAVYRHRGPYQRITHTYDVLVAAWVLSDRLELRDGPFVNTYLSVPGSVPDAELECELAIPIV